MALAAFPAGAAEDDAFEFFREEAKVYTASRRLEATAQAPVAVDVVTAEEIAAYGYRNLADLLRFRAGLDVSDARSADGNRASVTARGFTRDFVSEMQVLVDGRSVYSPFLGGVYWESLPVPMEDIERIEIVRGPNAALYGSNAALGVISIITRKPGSKARGGVTARGGNRSLYASEAAEAGSPLAGLRVSHSHETAPGNPAPDGTRDANDFLHSNKLNIRARVNPDKATELELMGGGVWQTMGVPGYAVDVRAKQAHDFQMLLAARDLGGAGSLEAVFSRSEMRLNQDRFLVSPVDLRVYQYDGELLHRSSWADERVRSAVGGSWRRSGVYSDQLFTGHPSQHNEVTRGFTHHSVRLSDALTAVAGVSVEDSRVGGLQTAWQGVALYSPVEDHTLRASYSHAPTMPPLFNKYGDFTLGATRFLGNPDLRPQQLHSWEAGWSGRTLDRSLKSCFTLYYMEIRDRIFQHVEIAGPPRVLDYDNRNRATARGAELSVEYALAVDRTLFANYTFEKILDDKGVDSAGTDLRSGTPLHKANLGARAALGRGFSASALVGYKDAFEANSTNRSTRRSIDRSLRVDARAAWAPRPGWQVFVAGVDLVQPYRVEAADGTASPRRFEGGMSVKFGL
ncbi:MAG: TonB-dependent receptor [Elusimicrobiota bacterium]|nr:TonB-dependent receptor [Elusimicrobiota bacterium]